MNTAPDAPADVSHTDLSADLSDLSRFEATLDVAVRELALSLTRIAVAQARRYQARLEAPDTPEASLHAEARSLVALVRAVRSLLPKPSTRAGVEPLPEAVAEFAALAPRPFSRQENPPPPSPASPAAMHVSRQVRRAYDRALLRARAHL